MKRIKSLFESPFLIFILILFIGFILSSQLPKKSPYYHHYYYLSKSLVQGNLGLTEVLKTVFDTPEKMNRVFDYAFFNNQYFLHLGIFPAILGIPLLSLGPEGFSLILVILLLGLTVLFLTKMVDYFLREKPLFFSLALVISSPLLTTLVWKGPWYLTGLISFAFGLLFLWYYPIKRKEWSIFFIIPLVLTRPTTIFYALIPGLDILSSPKKHKKKIVFLGLALFIALTVFLGYNYLRFGHPLETGYKYTIVPQEEFVSFRAKETSFKEHFFSNAIYMFINPPRVHINKALRYTFPYFELSRYGVGLIFSIPWFFSYLFFNQKMGKDWPYLITALTIILAILSFRSEGSFQISSRYSCDFLPLLLYVNLRWLGKNKSYLLLFQKLLSIALVVNIYFFLLVQLGHMSRV